MTGIEMTELIELLSHGHEAEFTYREKTYVIQPEMHEDQAFLVVWDCSLDGKCISRCAIPEHGDIPVQDIIHVLNDKCFSGRSFMEIEGDITVDVIF